MVECWTECKTFTKTTYMVQVKYLLAEVEDGLHLGICRYWWPFEAPTRPTSLIVFSWLRVSFCSLLYHFGFFLIAFCYQGV